MGLRWENCCKNLLDSLAMPSVGLVPQLKSLVNAGRGSRWNCSPRKINLCKTKTLLVSLPEIRIRIRNCQKIFKPQLLIPEDALLCGEVDLDGGVSPGVIDLAGVDLLDGHLAGKPADLQDGGFFNNPVLPTSQSLTCVTSRTQSECLLPSKEAAKAKRNHDSGRCSLKRFSVEYFRLDTRHFQNGSHGLGRCSFRAFAFHTSPLDVLPLSHVLAISQAKFGHI